MRTSLLYWVLSAVSATALLSASAFAMSQDGYTLLEIKDALNDSGGFLNNWRASDANPCNWTGISCHFDDQQVRSIDLPYMQLKGIISPGIGKLKRLQRMALHQNSLHGIIPTEITQCTDLRALYLRANYLQGNIPPELGNLSHLTILDLSSNSLTGSIPSSISHLTQLHLLNLSTNFFSGEIPNIGVLNTFGNKSFTGNLDLCGQQIQKPCPNSLGFPAVLPHEEQGEPVPQVPTKRSSHYLNGVLIGAMSTMAFVLVMLLIFLWIHFLSKKESAAKKYREVKKQVDQESSKLLKGYTCFLWINLSIYLAK
ncbi:hypothetical protein NE237_007232 [Protea cynaroides]|uniref:Leucine-rich repeat-containing N-terminal plant-type domain-containing protein n=1 Tax=Protea cynaroides TaxID=273540 RepID=A0A9Q0KNR8_9MAGN|nr:hypothetical protein NE237_007232 [Protea cynaroides]